MTPTQIVEEMSFHEKPKKVRSVDSPSEEAICCPNGTPKRIWA